MRVTQETLTVLPDVRQREVTIVTSGFRLTLTLEEARLLAEGLRDGLDQLEEAAEATAVPDLSAVVGARGAEEAGKAGVSLMITQGQRTALRGKGYTDDAIRQMKPAEAHRILGVG